MNVRKLIDADRTPLVTAELDDGFSFMARLAREYGSGDFARAGFLLLGVYDGNALLGVGGITPDPYQNDPKVGRIRHLYILPEARRRGVGKELLEALVASVPAQYSRLRLRTMTERGAAFYRAAGFSPYLEPEATYSLELQAFRR